MNPEEGELRPQLLDRFGLCVEVTGEKEIGLRKEIVDRVLAFEGTGAGFRSSWRDRDREVLAAVNGARERLEGVEIPGELVETAAELVVLLRVAGHRGELAILKTARALAAWRGSAVPEAGDFKDGVRLALPHRIPRSGVSRTISRQVARLLARAFPGAMEEGEEEPVVPLPDTPHGMKRAGVVFRGPTVSPEEMERQAIAQATAARRRSEAAARTETPGHCGDPDCDYCQGFAESNVFSPATTYQVRKIVVPKGRRLLDASGKRSKARTEGTRGRYVRSGPWRKGRDVAMDATLLTAVTNGHVERGSGRIRVAVSDLRGKRRERRVGNLILVVLDASASMETQRRMVATKGAVLSLLRDAYVKRDRVGLISFRDSVAEVVVPPTGSAALAAHQLAWLASGGTTPLSTGLFAAVKTLETEQVRDPDRKPLLVLITDGRANVAWLGGEPFLEAIKVAKLFRAMRVESIVIDTDRVMVGPAALRMSMEAHEKIAGTRGIYSGGPARSVADAMGAKYLSLAEMSQAAILAAIRSRRMV